jgi:hypothetical protein
VFQADISNQNQVSKKSINTVARVRYEFVKSQSEAQFKVPGWGDKVDYGLGCRTGPSGYIGWQSVRQTYAIVDFIPPVRDYEFGYRTTSWTYRKRGMLCQSFEDLTDDPAGFEQLLPLVVAEGNPEAGRVEVLSPWRNFRRGDQSH